MQWTDGAPDNGAHYQQNEQPEASQQDKDNATRQVQKSLDGGEIGSQRTTICLRSRRPAQREFS